MSQKKGLIFSTQIPKITVHHGQKKPYLFCSQSFSIDVTICCFGIVNFNFFEWILMDYKYESVGDHPAPAPAPVRPQTMTSYPQHPHPPMGYTQLPSLTYFSQQAIRGFFLLSEFSLFKLFFSSCGWMICTKERILSFGFVYVKYIGKVCG